MPSQIYADPSKKVLKSSTKADHLLAKERPHMVLAPDMRPAENGFIPTEHMLKPLGNLEPQR
jgi:hypothetical protein